MADGNIMHQAEPIVIERSERVAFLVSEVQRILKAVSHNPALRLCGAVRIFDEDFGFQIFPSHEGNCLTADIFLGNNRVARLCNLDPKAILTGFNAVAAQLIYQNNVSDEIKPFDLPICDDPNQPAMLRACDYAALGAKDFISQSSNMAETQYIELIIAGMLRLYEEILKAYEDQEKQEQNERELKGHALMETIQNLNEQARELTSAALTSNNPPT